MNEKIYDERIHKETGRYGMQTVFIMSFTLFIECIILKFSHMPWYTWLFDLFLFISGFGYFLSKVLSNGTLKDERIKKDNQDSSMKVLLYYILFIFAELMIKFFIMHKPSKEWVGSLIILIIGMTYFSLQLYLHGLNAPSSISGLNLPEMETQYKKKTYKDYAVTNLLLAASWVFLDLSYPEILYYIPVSNKILSIVITVILELFTCFIIGLLMDIFTYKLTSKISQKQNYED